jgi:hypothetical protein
VLLAWCVPVAVLLASLVWLVPLAGRSAASRTLVDEAIGNWVVLAIWLTLSCSLAIVSTMLRRTGRTLGGAWAVLQVVLLAAGVVWSLPPIVVGAAGLEAIVAGAVHLVLPVVVLVLSAAQGVVLFVRA